LQFADRIKAVLQEIQEKYTGKTILIVSHGGALDMMYRMASNQALEAERVITVPNASLNWISCDGTNWKVDSWADTSHLDGLALGNLEL
jgi:probable phosphoglycerate mutase